MLKRWKIICLAAAVAFGGAARAEEAAKEYLVKAAFIYNFVKFVEWPGELAVAQQKEINICVIGKNPFNSQGKDVFTRASTSALKLSLTEKGGWSGSADGCHIAFISSSEEPRLAEIASALKSAPVLTVSDIDNFAERGGIIGFVTQDNKVKVAVNTKVAGGAGLRVDAQLLEIAVKVIRN